MGHSLQQFKYNSLKTVKATEDILDIKRYKFANKGDTLNVISEDHGDVLILQNSKGERFSAKKDKTDYS